jgi:hypothetical protein
LTERNGLVLKSQANLVTTTTNNIELTYDYIFIYIYISIYISHVFAQVISVQTLSLVDAPRSYRSFSSLSKVSYDSLALACHRAGLADRRMPRKVLTTRLVLCARMLAEDEYKDLNTRYHAGQIHALVEAPTPAPSHLSHSTAPHRSGQTQESSRTEDLSFAEIDADSNGTISPEELQIALTRDGELDFKLRTCQLLINMVDVDNDGCIDRFEFPVLLRYLDDWEQAFASYDLDGNGSIDTYVCMYVCIYVYVFMYV